MKTDLAQLAINAALECDWEAALQLNKEILKKNPQDVDAINRMAKAYYELGEIKKALNYTQKAIEIDPLNSIALRCSDKYKSATNVEAKQTAKMDHQTFLEEPGKTKIVSLLHLGDRKIILSLDSGVRVEMIVGKHKVSICTQEGKYIGRFPDDLARRMITLIRNGNKYQVYIKACTNSEVRVFIREVERASSQASRPSFPLDKRLAGVGAN